MAKTTKPRDNRPANPETESNETITISVRFTEQQRDLLARAAETRGWTPTNLVRVAALERAVHLLNLSEENSVDFNRLAMQIAEQLFGIHTYHLIGQHGEREECVLGQDSDPNADLPIIDVEPEPLPPSTLADVLEAARFGGAEFMNLIVDSCRAIAAHSRGDLPRPIDPSAV